MSKRQKKKRSREVISLFDIIGPVMIGPSSSHTAGAAKIGYEAFKLLKDSPQKVTIKLFNSFSDTGKGHKTDLALLGGCIGLKPDDEKLIRAEQIAEQKGVDYQIKWGYHSNDFHPNTAIVKLQKDNLKISLIGYSIGGGRIEIAKSTVKTIKRQSDFHQDELELSLGKPKTKSASKETYFSFEEINKKIQTSKQFFKLALSTEAKTSRMSEEQVTAEFKKRWLIMIQSVEKGIKIRQRSKDGLFGGDSNRMLRSRYNLLSKVVEDAITYSIGVGELNAKMGKIVAAPTAGSCGIVPGVLFALRQKLKFSQNKMAEALLIAGSIGAIVNRQVGLAGAVAGCQAEIGVAGSMAAAAGVYLMGGNLKKIEAAASLVLANVLGLTCDPVMGRVEVPCIIRSGLIANMSMAAIEMALDGVTYSIPFDQVVEVMKKVGLDMKEEYRETGTGGLATTIAAKNICQRCRGCG